MNRPPPYALGSDDAEIARLDQQASVIADATAMLLRAAGIGAGMHVIDFGTGPGHVAFQLADLVGPTGFVTGVDQSGRLLELAEQRRATSGRGHVRFVEGDARTYRGDAPVDAVVARLLLFHLPDAGDVVRHFAGLLRAGGTALLLDFDIGSARTHPTAPLAVAAREWVDAGFRAAGADPSIGARLGGLLRDAGLDEIRAVGIQPYLEASDPMATRLLGGVVRALSPALLAAGIVGEAELGLDTFEQRLADELRAANAVFLPPALVGAWGRCPDGQVGSRVAA
jgi:ubiquinone/menaquinone biosynthesis C-methylase UbiE